MNDVRQADLILEGGGVKGIGLVGALSALDAAGYRFGGKGRVAGTSAGAVVGALVAAGLAIPQAVALMSETDLGDFRDSPPFGPFGRGLSLLTRLGMYRGDHLHSWISAQLDKLGVRTFGELRLEDPDSDLPPERSYKLVVIVSDLTNGRMVRLPWDYHHYGLNADDQLVADAVRASAAIPFVFPPVRLRDIDGHTAILTDGGLLSNFPIAIFDRQDVRPPRWPTFGIKLSNEPPEEWHSTQEGGIGGPIGFATALISTMINAHDRYELDDPAARARTVFVGTDGVDATDFDLAPMAQETLFGSGREAAEKFLATWSFEDYLDRYRGHPAPKQTNVDSGSSADAAASAMAGAVPSATRR